MHFLLDKEKFASEKFDIILLIGQSNAEGFGRGEVADAYEPTENVMHLTDSYHVTFEMTPENEGILHIDENSAYKIEPAEETIHPERGILGCFALPFAKKYYESYLSSTDRKVMVIRAAVGSTGFLRGNWALDDKLYKRAVEMTDMALSLNKENRLAAILWHQGESDAIEGRRRGGYDFLYPYYLERFNELVCDLRKRYGILPFIAGAMCRDWTPRIKEASDAVEDATRAVLSKAGCGAFVESDSLTSNDSILHNGDSIHFSRSSLYELGNRYFKLYENLR